MCVFDQHHIRVMCRCLYIYILIPPQLNTPLHKTKSISWPAFEPRFVIDTGRNGQGAMRKSCSNWCNIRGAGIGQRPTTETGKSVSWGWID